MEINGYWVHLFSGSERQKAALRLLAVSKLINQAVGDALSGLLLVEAILQHMGWSIHQWNELYQDLPSRQLKVSILENSSKEVLSTQQLGNLTTFTFCTKYEPLVMRESSAYAL